MAEIIDLFTRQPIKVEPTGSEADESERRRWFKKWAERGPERLDGHDQTEWIIAFHEYYLAAFLDAVEGVREATEVQDLAHHMATAMREMKKWPKS